MGGSISLYATHLVRTCKRKSQTVKSYRSAIRYILKGENISVRENSYIPLSSMKACKLENADVKTRLLIQKGLLKLILDQIESNFLNKNQPYLAHLYKATIITGYYGLFRVGELTLSTYHQGY